MITLTDMYPIRKAGVYPNAKQESDLLPVPYGDLRYGSVPVWPCPCVDTVLNKYCVADCAITTANVTLYDEGVLTTGYTLSVISGVAIATFSAAPSGNISARGTGKVVGGVLLENPVDILYDILTTSGYDVENGIDLSAWNEAMNQIEASGMKAAGVILQERSLQEIFTEILVSFLGSFWMTPEHLLYLSFDIVGVTSYAVYGIISERQMNAVSAKQSLDNLCNQAEVYFAPAFLSSDRRFSEGGSTEFIGYDNGANQRNGESQAQFGVQLGSEPFFCRWLYARNSVEIFQARITEKFGWPFWVLQFTELSYKNLHVHQGQYSLFSWRGLCDEQQRPLRNQIGRVLSKRILLNQRGIMWGIADTGFYFSYPPAVLDGDLLFDGSVVLGGERNRHVL